MVRDSGSLGSESGSEPFLPWALQGYNLKAQLSVNLISGIQVCKQHKPLSPNTWLNSTHVNSPMLFLRSFDGAPIQLRPGSGFGRSLPFRCDLQRPWAPSPHTFERRHSVWQLPSGIFVNRKACARRLALNRSIRNSGTVCGRETRTP